MNDILPISELTSKIEKVKKDLQTLMDNGSDDKQIRILAEYKSYLEDELKELKNENRSRTST